jgi:plastocyanin
MKKQLLFIATFFVSLFISQNVYSTQYVVSTAGNTFGVNTNLSINIGDTVTWINTGGFHNINATLATYPGNPEGFGNAVAGAGWSFQWIFTIAGTYDYQCDPHIPAMVGVVIVASAASNPTLDSVVTTTPITCYGGTADIMVYITQTSPSTPLVYILQLQNPNGLYLPFGQAPFPGTTSGTVQPFTSLAAGQYQIRLKDSLGGYIPNATFPFTISEPSQLIVTGNVLPPPPTVGNSINTSTSGGAPGYTYSWTGPNGFSSSSANITNLSPGNYTVIVTDLNGCDDDSTFAIQPPPPSWDCNPGNGCSDPGTGLGSYNDSLLCVQDCPTCGPGNISAVNVTCYAAVDGEISLSNAFGVSPFTFSVDTANPYTPGYVPSVLYQDTTILNSSYVFNNLGKGDYFVIFEDASGCSDTSLIIVDRFADPFSIDSTINLVSDTGLSDGSIFIDFVTGGSTSTNPLVYNYTWYDSLGNIVQDSSLNTLSNLGVGIYSVVITDNGPNLCESLPYTFVMGLRQNCDADSVIIHNVCPGSNEGSAKINYLSGWDDYQFYDSVWDPLGPANTDSIEDLFAGNYYFVLDSSSLCPEDTIQFQILEPIIDSIYIVDAVSGNNLCSGDSSRIFVDIYLPNTNLTYYYYIDGSIPGQLVGDTTDNYFIPTYTLGILDSLYLGLQYDNGIGLSSCLNSPGYSSTPFIINEFNLSIDDAFTTDEICGVSSATLTIDIDSINVSNFPVSFFINGMSSIISSTFNIPHSVIYDSIYIEDAVGCKVYWDFPLMAEQIINTTIDTNIIKESCRENDGEINLLLDNGQGFYNYTLSKAIPFNIPLVIESDTTSTSVLASISIDSLVAGTYFIEITDDSSCVSLLTLEVDQVVPFTLLPLTKVKETCCGYDGSIKVNVDNVEGGSLNYTLEFDTIAIAIAFANNVYPYTINNAVWPSQSYLTSFNISDTSSYFDSLTGVYSYIFDSLTRGYYSIFVEDEFGCVDSADYSGFIASGNSGINTHLSIDDSYVIDMSYSYTDIVCFEDTNATIKVLYPDACYSYELLLYSDTANPSLIAVDSISFPDTSVYYNELYAGIYGIQAMSTSGFAGCVRRSDTFQIIEPDIISYDSLLSTPAFCLNGGFAIDGGACNGTVFLPNSPTGGVYDTSAVVGDTVYQYYINRVNSTVNYFQGPIVSDSIFSGLCPGDYEVQVLDGNNCIIKDTVSVGDNSLYIDSFLVTTISCYDSSDATIQVFAHGGVGTDSTNTVGPYDYVWTDSTNSIVGFNQLVDSLLEGMYFVTVSDSAGCIAVDSAFVSGAPDSLYLAGRVPGFKAEETCNGYSYNGYVGYEITGGSGPYVFNWINSDSSRTGSYTAYAQYCDTCISSDGISSIDSVYMLDSLTADIYKVTLTDANGCPSDVWFPIDSISITALNINNPLSIDSILGSDTLCYDASNGFLNVYVNDSVYLPLTFELDSNVLTHIIF